MWVRPLRKVQLGAALAAAGALVVVLYGFALAFALREEGEVRGAMWLVAGGFVAMMLGFLLFRLGKRPKSG